MLTVSLLSPPLLVCSSKDSKGCLLPYFNLIDCQGDWCIDAALKFRGLYAIDSHAYSLTCKVCHGGHSDRSGCLVYQIMSNNSTVYKSSATYNLTLDEGTG